jgi:hypothetical protein
MNAPDLFPASLVGIDDFSDEACAELVFGMLGDTLRTFRYAHSESEHKDILAMLGTPEFERLFDGAILHECGEAESMYRDYETFCNVLRFTAKQARKNGLVRPDGLPRQRKPKEADEESETLDLFASEPECA